MSDITASQINRYRLLLGLTMKELAEKVGVAEGTISYWEANKSSPRMDSVIKMAEIFGIEPSIIIFGENKATPPQEYDPDAEEILALLERPDMHDLKMLFLKTGNLSQEDKEQIVRILKATLPLDNDC